MRKLSDLEKQAAAELLRLEKRYEKEIQLELKNALLKMRGEMSVIYDKYAIDGKLTNAQMTKYNRYAAMEKQMLADLNPAIRKNIGTIKRLSPAQYQEAFFHYAWAMDNGNGVRINYGTLNKDVITRNLANPWVDIALDRFKQNATVYIRIALNQGLSLGKSYPQMARDITAATNRTYQDAIRIVRTEGQAAVNAGQNDLYIKAKEKGIEGNQIWDATLDGDTRPTHQAMDGQQKGNDGLYLGPGTEKAPYPAYHGLSAKERINCRCRERFQVDGYSPTVRRTREQGLIPYQIYPEWLKNYN